MDVKMVNARVNVVPKRKECPNWAVSNVKLKAISGSAIAISTSSIVDIAFVVTTC